MNYTLVQVGFFKHLVPSKVCALVWFRQNLLVHSTALNGTYAHSSERLKCWKIPTASAFYFWWRMLVYFWPRHVCTYSYYVLSFVYILSIKKDCLVLNLLFFYFKEMLGSVGESTPCSVCSSTIMFFPIVFLDFNESKLSYREQHSGLPIWK